MSAQTKLGAACRELATKVRKTGDDVNALRLERTAANLDANAVNLGARGAGVKNLASYNQAAGIYAQVAGKPYGG